MNIDFWISKSQMKVIDKLSRVTSDGDRVKRISLIMDEKKLYISISKSNFKSW